MRFPVLALAVAFRVSVASACPLVGGLVDYNCDQKIKMVFTGDSIVWGVRDTRMVNPGYPGRLKDAFPDAEIVNLGVPGNSSQQLYSGFKRYLTREASGKTFSSSRSADYFFIEIGTNDWLTNRPDLTVRNISRLIKYVSRTTQQIDGTSPVFTVATLTPNVRVGNSEFSKKVNKLLLEAKKRGQLPVYVRVDDMPIKFLDDDGLHPDPKGYNFMARRFKSFIAGRLQRLCIARRPDRDSDGLYDSLESLRFGTSRYLTDTDGDGVSDGDEVFATLTDPLVPNTF